MIFGHLEGIMVDTIPIRGRGVGPLHTPEKLAF
jgi:hypothetical protein